MIKDIRLLLSEQIKEDKHLVQPDCSLLLRKAWQKTRCLSCSFNLTFFLLTSNSHDATLGAAAAAQRHTRLSLFGHNDDLLPKASSYKWIRNGT